MANTQYFKLSYGLIDGGGLRANMAIYGKLDPTQTVTAILTEATAQATLLNGVSDCKILDNFLEIGVPLPDQSALPANGVDAEKTALITFNNADSPVRAYGQDTPGVAALILSSPKVIDTGAGGYTAWRNSFTSAQTHWQLTDQTQNFLTGARTAAVTFRKRRKGQSKLSDEAG